MPYRVMTFGGPLNMGTAGSHYVELAARAKCNSGVSPYCVPNEYVCAKLGQFLGLPIAPGDIIIAPGNDPKFWYAALDFSREGESLPPVIPEDCLRLMPDLCNGIVLFDILIANGDRSENNLFLDDSGTTPEMRLFDHELALLGATPGQAEGRLTGSVRGELGIPGSLPQEAYSAGSLIRKRLDAADRRAARLPNRADVLGSGTVWNDARGNRRLCHVFEGEAS